MTLVGMVMDSAPAMRWSRMLRVALFVSCVSACSVGNPSVRGPTDAAHDFLEEDVDYANGFFAEDHVVNECKAVFDDWQVPVGLDYPTFSGIYDVFGVGMSGDYIDGFDLNARWFFHEEDGETSVSEPVLAFECAPEAPGQMYSTRQYEGFLVKCFHGSDQVVLAMNEETYQNLYVTMYGQGGRLTVCGDLVCQTHDVNFFRSRGRRSHDGRRKVEMGPEWYELSKTPRRNAVGVVSKAIRRCLR